MDDNSEEQLTKAEKLAEDNGIKVFLSNPCFEIWFLLHFEEVTSAQDRHDLYERLKSYIKNYKKCREVYPVLRSRQENAIDNAKHLNELHEGKGISLSSRDCNPSTQVFRIIEYIQSLRKDAF